jgi:hypothetical protein
MYLLLALSIHPITPVHRCITAITGNASKCPSIREVRHLSNVGNKGTQVVDWLYIRPPTIFRRRVGSWGKAEPYSSSTHNRRI